MTSEWVHQVVGQELATMQTAAGTCVALAVTKLRAGLPAVILCRLLGTFGGEDVPCCGFGFGDAVIVELLKERGKLPQPPHKVGPEDKEA